MTGMVFGFGIFIAVLSVLGMLWPRRLASAVVHTVKQPWGMTFAIGVRVGLGALFLASAQQASHPMFIRILGWLFLASAAGVALMGRQKMLGVTNYFLGKGNKLIRAWLLIGVVLGLAIIWAA